jgi:ABC-type sugar transport system substrate-binding protein
MPAAGSNDAALDAAREDNRMQRRFLVAGAVAAALAAAPFANAKQMTIAGIVFQQDQFFRAIQLGMQAGAKANSVKLLGADSDNKLEREASLIQTYIASGVDGIVISPISAKASYPALKRAADKGIKIVTYNSPLDGNITSAFLTSQQEDLGKTTGAAAQRFIAEKLGGRAKVAVLAFKSQFPEISAQRVGGFVDTIKQGANIDVVAQQDAWLAEKAVAVASDIITANPDINIIYAANEGGTVGAVQAVRRAGKQGKIFVFGVDGSEQLANFLLDADNVLQATTAQQPFEMGKQAVQTAVDVLGDKPVQTNIIVPVLGLRRTDPKAVEAYKAELKSYQ